MALPYYLPPSAPMMTPSVNDCYPVPATSYEQVHQMQRQHNIYTMAYLQGMHYVPATGFGYNYPTIFAPQISNFAKPLTFSHSTTSQVYPISPVPVRSLAYTVTQESTQSYRSQLRQVAKRVAESDASTQVESKKLKVSESESNTLSSSGDEFLKVAVPENIPTTCFREPHIYPESNVNSLFGGPYAISDRHFRISEQNCTPESGQQHISKMKALVERIQTNETNNVSPPSQKTSKEKKTRQKTKSRSLDQLDSLTPCKKRSRVEETTQVKPLELFMSTSSWYPRPVPYANDHFMIEANATIVSRSFYATIPWESCEKSIRMLVDHFFNKHTLATHNLEGEIPLNLKIVEDITNHVAERCQVGRDYVRSVISAICAEAARMCLAF